MAGTDNIRGITYQQVHAIHRALDLVEAFPEHFLRIEGFDDVVDIETLDSAGNLIDAQQVKSKANGQWFPEPLREIFRRWASLQVDGVQFTVVTDGQLGPGARALRDILAREGNGRREAVAAELSLTDKEASFLEGARVIVDPSSVGALLSSAERRVLSLMDPLERDRPQVAAQRVDTLFSALTRRATNADPSARVWSAAELTALIGGAPGVQVHEHWEHLEGEYLRRFSGETKLVPLTLSPWGGGDPTPPHEALLKAGHAALTGTTGTGKSSATEIARAWAADNQQAVILCRAELYLPGRLDSLLADSLGLALGRAVPAFVGREILADANATVIIDGASEIPQAAVDELSRDLRLVLSRPALARMVVVGRDVAVLRRLLAPTARVNTYVVQPLQQEKQLLLARNVLGDHHSNEYLTGVLRRAKHSLGIGATNPLLLTIYLEAMSADSREVSRVQVYETFLNRLCERAPSAVARMHMPILGVVFAELLREERRFADPYEWIARVDAAATAIPGAPPGEAIRDVARRMGLVTEVGLTGVVVPFHDSVADYLAAVAVQRKLAPLPTLLRESDAEWVKFAAELHVDVAEPVVRDLPFLAVSVSKHDLTSDGRHVDVGFVTELLNALLDLDGVVVSIVSQLDGRRKAEAHTPDGRWMGAAIIESSYGPLYIAVRLWRLALRHRLSAAHPAVTRAPVNREDAERLVAESARKTQDEIELLLGQFPERQRERLLSDLRPLGISFFVGERSDDEQVPQWPLTYTATREVRALSEAPNGSHGSTTVRYFLSDGPAKAAQKYVRDAIDRLVDTGRWLA